jgi:hypothetical protein
MYEVTVGNIGSVYNGNDIKEAHSLFETYKSMSVDSHGGRAWGESIFLFEHYRNGSDIIREFIGFLDSEG